MRVWRTSACVAALLYIGTVQARFVVEQAGISIKFPASARQKYKNGFEMSIANFGSPKYGGAVVGSLVYVSKDWGYDQTCPSAECNYGCDDFADSHPRLSLDKKTQYIMLIDRGPEGRGKTPCKFAEKVWNAQNAGAAGAIIVNYEDRKTTMEAPNDEDDSMTYLQNITIPAAFVTKSVGDALKGLIKPTGRDKDPHAMVSMDWVDILPRSEVVRHDLPLDHHSSPDVRCRRLFVSAGQAALTTLDCLYLCPLVNRPLRLCNVCNNETNTILRTTFCARKVMHMPAAALQC